MSQFSEMREELVKKGYKVVLRGSVVSATRADGKVFQAIGAANVNRLLKKLLEDKNNYEPYTGLL